ATASASADASPTATATAPRTGSASPSPSRSATRSPSPTNSPPQGQVLRRGDTGPDVEELQLRLSEMGWYWGPANGKYGRFVESAVADYQQWANVIGDPEGVYGPATRRSLEAQSHEP
ncbi:peptidoglycan-binding domain-containing protein, partial [Streptomyces sp. 12297]